MSKKEVATVVVVNKDKEILILKRSKTSTWPGYWNFPGGSVEDGEANDLAAARELKEEADLNVELKDLSYLGTLSTSKLNVHIYIANKYSGSVKINKESDDYNWISLLKIDNYKFVGETGKLNRDILKSIEEWINNG